MTIAVLCRMLQKEKLEGIGRFAHETLGRIVRAHPDHEFVFLFDRPYHRDFIYAENVRPVVLHQIGGAARHVAQIAYWHQHTLKRYLTRNKVDLLLSPDGNIPLSAPVPSVAVIHDINFEHYPQDLPWTVQKFYRYYFPRIVQRAEKILTVSEFSKKDIAKTYRIEESKISVVYNGVSDSFRPSEGGRKDYFLFLGSLHKRKNVEGLVDAFQKFKTGSSPMKLVIAGASRWEKIAVTDKDIIFKGRVPEAELPALMAGAFALMMVSKFEGFGIPVIEAMKSGVPVICSNTSALPEIAGDAALLVDPFSTDAIAAAMSRMTSDVALRHSLIKKGLERADLFTWEKAAEEVWRNVKEVLNT